MRSCHLQTYKFTPSFLMWIPFMSSSCLILARTWDTVLNRSGQSEYPCLVPPDLKGRALSFSCWVWCSLSGPCSLTTLLTCFTTSTWTQNPRSPSSFPTPRCLSSASSPPSTCPLPASLLCFKQQQKRKWQCPRPHHSSAFGPILSGRGRSLSWTVVSLVWV